MEDKTNLIPITIEKTERILNQMKWSMVKISNKNGQGTGFFCHISINNKDTPILITNNRIIDEATIKNNKEIKVTINDKEEKNININKNRMIIISKKYNVTIIEIKPDEDNICYFLDLDSNYLNKKSNFFNEAIYIIHYPTFQKEQKACVSYGMLKNKADSNDIVYSCNTNSGSSGSPIIRLSNNKVIGIHHYENNSFYTRNIFQSIIKEYLNKKENLKNSNNLFILDYKNEENDIRRSTGQKKETEEIENYKKRRKVLGPKTTEEGLRKRSQNITNSTILGPETSELEIGEAPNETPSEKSNNISNFFLDNYILENKNLKEEIPINRNSIQISSISLEHENQIKEKKANLSHSESQSVIKLGPEVEDESEKENNNINPIEPKNDNNLKKDNDSLVEKQNNDINNNNKDDSNEDNFMNDEIIKNQNKNTMSVVGNQKSKTYINKKIDFDMNKNNNYNSIFANMNNKMLNKNNFNMKKMNNMNNMNNNLNNNNMNKINNNMNYINDNKNNLNNNNMNNNNMNNNNMNNNNMNNNMANNNLNNNMNNGNNNMNNNMANNNLNNNMNNNNFGNNNMGNINMNNNMNNNNMGNNNMGINNNNNQNNQFNNNNNNNYNPNNQLNNQMLQNQNNPVNNNNIDISDITVLRNGDIDKNTIDNIRSICKRELQQNQSPADNIAQNLKKTLNKEWFVIVVDKSINNFDFKFSQFEDESVLVLSYQQKEIYIHDL